MDNNKCLVGPPLGNAGVEMCGLLEISGDPSETEHRTAPPTIRDRDRTGYHSLWIRLAYSEDHASLGRYLSECAGIVREFC
jgi:hypothetical protein